MKHQHLAAALSLPLALALTGCGDANGSQSQGAVTVTVRPTVTASPTTQDSSSSSSSTTARAVLPSDVKGRAFDFGTVTGVRTVKGVEVLTLDRWTWKGLDDKKLAASGVPVRPFKGTPYENQNAKLTYDIPLAESARLLHHHCVAADQPLQTKSVSAKELAGLADRENLVLVKLDGRGHVVAADNLPGCPS
jgi:hypothetical protein